MNVFCFFGGVFFPPMSQPIILVLLDIPPMLPVLDGVVMELQDCALPLLRGQHLVPFTPRAAFSRQSRVKRADRRSVYLHWRSRIRKKDRKEWFRFAARVFPLNVTESLFTHSPLLVSTDDETGSRFAEARFGLHIWNALPLRFLKT